MNDHIYHPDYVKDLFNRISSSYERMNYLTSFGFSIRWRKQFLSACKQTYQPIEIIDLLTGMGETWGLIKQRWPQSKLTALDFSEGMLRYVNQKSEARFGGQVTVLQEDILKNKLPSNHFDLVTCAFGLKTFDEEQLHILASETQRILKPGGQFSFVEVSKPRPVMLQVLYGFYLGQVIPVLGRLLLGNPTEYKMLWQYTQQFRHAERASEIFAKTGLKTKFVSYFFGCATGFLGEKKV